MKFLPLLELNVIHGYYPDGRCPDFQIIPTLTTQHLLKNHRCVLKTGPNGIRILISVTGQNAPFIPLSEGAIFAFQLRLQNPDFSLFTDLDSYNKFTAPLYRNPDLNETLTLDSKKAEVTEQLAVMQPAQNVQYTLSGKPMVGLTPSDFALTGLGAATSPTAYDPAAKLITVDTTAAQIGDLFQVTYATKPQQMPDTFAEVEIQYSDTWPALETGSKKFQITFTPKAARWRYYIIADNANIEFQINDKAADPFQFSDSNRTDLNQNPDNLDPVAVSLAQKYPAKQRLRLASDNLILCQQQARKTLQLRLAGDQVIETLPNPSLYNYVIADVSTNGVEQRELVLYQIVKYFAHKFQTTGG